MHFVVKLLSLRLCRILHMVLHLVDRYCTLVHSIKARVHGNQWYIGKT
jgi:hypothetical protein